MNPTIMAYIWVVGMIIAALIEDKQLWLFCMLIANLWSIAGILILELRKPIGGNHVR